MHDVTSQEIMQTLQMINNFQIILCLTERTNHQLHLKNVCVQIKNKIVQNIPDVKDSTTFYF